jgi:hypothetical protein
MSMKRMKHPQHGFHHPLSGGELATMLANGWTYDETPETAAGDTQTASAPDSTTAPSIAPPAASMNRDDMKAKATSLGITFKHNISNAALAELIAAAPKAE